MQTSTSDGETILLEGVKGKRRVSKDDGGEKKDENGKKKEGSVMGSYFRIFSYNDTTGRIVTIIAMVCVVATGVLLPLMNYVFGKFVNVFNDFMTGRKTPDEFRASLNQYALYFVYLFVAKLVLSYIWTTLIAINAIRVTRALRIDFLRQTLRQDITYFDTASEGGGGGGGGGGALAASITTDANLAHQGIAEKLGLTVQALTTFFAAFGVAFGVQWKLTLITMCVVPAILLVIGAVATLDAALDARIMAHWAQADRLADDVLASIRSVHAFWAFDALAAKHDAHLDAARAIGRRKPPLSAIMFCTLYFCIYAGYALAFWQGVHMYHRGEIRDPGQIVTVILSVLMAAQGLVLLAPQISAVSKAAAAASALFRVIDRVPPIDALADAGERPVTCHGDLCLDNVSFAYPSRPGVPVLDGLTLHIPANKTTAIVGPSGSGKSTVVGLLERWFAPAAGGGSITLDGQPIERLNITWLRTTMRLVQQEPVLLAGSVFENVAHGLAGTAQAALPDAEKLRLVEAACLSAYADEFVRRLPQGYHTQIGERGALLSGGQKQRLVIARSIVGNPRILLLDEATSALDPAAERIVQRALSAAAADRTTLVIAHRLSTIRDADNIVVMAKGRIVEQGTHGALMARQGAYHRLVCSQDLGQGEGGEDAKDEDIVEAPDPVVDTAETHADVDVDYAASPPTDYGLVRCLAIIIKEQKSLRVPFAVLGIMACFAGGIYPSLAILFSRIMAIFTLPPDEMVRRGDFYALMFFVMALGILVAYGTLGWTLAVVSQGVANNYRAAAFRAVLRQPMAFFDDPAHSTGALVARLAAEPTALQELLSSNVSLIVTVSVSLVSSCVLAIATAWRLGLVLTFGALPPLVGAGFVRIRLEMRLDAATATRFAASAGIAAEAVRAIRTVASLTLERDVLARYAAAQGALGRTAVRSLVGTMAWYALSQSLSFLAMALGFWYGGRLLSFGIYSAQQFYTAFIAVLFAGETAASFVMFATSITEAQRAANYIFGLQRGVPENMEDDPDALEGESVGQHGAVAIACEQLGFAYPRRPHAPVLRDLSLAIEPGQFVAFVGASGCGKTTMVSLLERFYDPTRGVLRLDGRDSRSVRPRASRRHTALVEQTPVLFQGSVRDNVVLGADGESDERIWAACRMANIDTFLLSLPDGLATPCGAQGLQFSGGQRQRIALARALLWQPRLLLLDEATSSLDTASERQVQAALEAAATATVDGDSQRQMTTVAVAHRLSTVRRADAIFVFAQGRVVEAGSHAALLARRGLYYQMCLGQSVEGSEE